MLASATKDLKMTASGNHQFIHPTHGESRLVCPRCMELLHRIDIEHFPSCPYCNTPLDCDHDLEDFLLQPAVNCWLAHQLRQNDGLPSALPPPAE